MSTGLTRHLLSFRRRDKHSDPEKLDTCQSKIILFDAGISFKSQKFKEYLNGLQTGKIGLNKLTVHTSGICLHGIYSGSLIRQLKLDEFMSLHLDYLELWLLTAVSLDQTPRNPQDSVISALQSLAV